MSDFVANVMLVAFDFVYIIWFALMYGESFSLKEDVDDVRRKIKKDKQNVIFAIKSFAFSFIK